jgi:signal transduction histidine kinase
MAAKEILIVDDEFNTRFAIDFVLVNAGYKTTNAEDGSVALNLIKQKCLATNTLFDLVITDIKMPKMTGIELIDEMKNANINVPVLVISSFGDKQTVVELLRRECDDYLDKPFSPDDLLATVARILTKQSKKGQEIEALQESLVQSEKMSTLGQMASKIAHEINNPACVIQGFAELLLRDDTINGGAKKRVSTIYEAIRSITKLNHDMLNIARPHEIRNTELMPEVPLEKAVEFLRESGVVKHCKVVKQYRNNIIPVHGDLMQLQQVFLNILVNAAHAMESSPEKILTLTTDYVQGKNQVQISIQDSGCGIPAVHIEKIFESYFTTRAAQGGTGLGLAVVKQIIEKHDGTISVESEVSKGTRFTISLPQKNDLQS